MKLNKYLIIIVVILGLLSAFIFLTNSRKNIKTEIKNDIKISKDEVTGKINISKEKDQFLINYSVPSYLDSKNEISEKILINYKDLRAINKEETQFTFYNKPCTTDKKKYIVMMDISGSVLNAIGKDKYISDIDKNLNIVFQNTKLTVNDEIQIAFIGENKDSEISYDFIGPVFTGLKSENKVYHENTLEISNYTFTDIPKCGNNQLAKSFQEILSNINKSYKEKTEKNVAYNTFIGESIKNLKNDLSTKGKYSKVIYILFTDGDDNSGSNQAQSKNIDTGFLYCSQKNCGYEFLNYSNNDEAFVFWGNKGNETKFKKLFEGIKFYFN
jgi:hypothetical protein